MITSSTSRPASAQAARRASFPAAKRSLRPSAAKSVHFLLSGFRVVCRTRTSLDDDRHAAAAPAAAAAAASHRRACGRASASLPATEEGGRAGRRVPRTKNRRRIPNSAVFGTRACDALCQHASLLPEHRQLFANAACHDGGRTKRERAEGGRGAALVGRAGLDAAYVSGAWVVEVLPGSRHSSPGRRQ